MHVAAPTSRPDVPTGAGVVASDLIEAVDHVGLAVPDLDAALTLHTEVFGWRVVHRETNIDQGVVEAMLTIGDGSGAQLQLMAPLDDTSPIAKFLDRRGPGLQQLAYRVGDVVAVAELLRSQGMRLLYDSPRRGTAGSMINFVHPGDTGGVLIELVQSPDVDEAKNSSRNSPTPTDGLGQSTSQA